MIVVSSEKKEIMSILWIARNSSVKNEREKIEDEKGIADKVTVNVEGDSLKMDYLNSDERIYVIKT